MNMTIVLVIILLSVCLYTAILAIRMKRIKCKFKIIDQVNKSLIAFNEDYSNQIQNLTASNSSITAELKKSVENHGELVTRHAALTTKNRDDLQENQISLIKLNNEVRDWETKFQAIEFTFNVLQSTISYAFFNNLNEDIITFVSRIDKPDVEYKVESVRISFLNKDVMVGLLPSNVLKGTIKYYNVDKLIVK